jgi:shikimate dehydrogenase
MSAWRDVDAPGPNQSGIAVIGYNADLSLSSAILKCGLETAGKTAKVVSLDVYKGDFEDCINHLNSLGYKGVSVANPHKVDAARIAQRFWIARFSLGVANALSFDQGIFAQNTEVPAIANCVKHLTPATALVMGTGHAARSVVAGLLDAGWKVKVWNRNRNKTHILITLLSRYGSMEMSPEPDPSGCSLVVNATPIGAKAGEQPPLQWNRVLPRTVCFDLVYRRVATEFLRSASVRGLKTIDGRELAVEQCALSLEWWLGQPVNREPMRNVAGLRAAQ